MHTIEHNRQHDYERFEANRRFEEMTDIAERLGYPIDTTIRYEVRDGAAYALSDTVDRPFHNQTYQAWQRGKNLFTGDQAFEAERLRLEHEEALMVDAFGGGSLDGTVLIKLSKVPDAVVENKTSIKGYRRDLQRSFVRIYFRNDQGVGCRLFTLDHNDRLAMKRVGDLLCLDADQPSEKVLADHTLLDIKEDAELFVGALVARTIETYDAAILEQSGAVTKAGSYFIDRSDALRSVEKQASLFNEHMSTISTIMRLSGLTQSSEAQIEAQRERIAAAIKLASEGYDVHSSGDSAVAAEVESGNYGRECATATGMNQAQSANMENIWRQGECQVCFARTSVGSCMVCARCAAADDRGHDLLKMREDNLRNRRARQVARRSLEQATAKDPTPKDSAIQARYGQKIRVRKVITIGGQDTFVLNHDGEVIDKL